MSIVVVVRTTVLAGRAILGWRGGDMLSLAESLLSLRRCRSLRESARSIIGCILMLLQLLLPLNVGHDFLLLPDELFVKGFFKGCWRM